MHTLSPGANGFTFLTTSHLVLKLTFLVLFFLLRLEIKKKHNFFLIPGKVASMTEMRSVLERLWFEPYNRSPSSSTLDTSGFEHVMVGEFKSSSQVNGMHYWLSFYQLEKSGDIEYYGHSCSTRVSVGLLVKEMRIDYERVLNNAQAGMEFAEWKCQYRMLWARV